MNSAVGPIFNENFAKKKVCESHKQCMEPNDRRIFQSLGVIFGYYSHGAHRLWTPNANVALKRCIQTLPKLSSTSSLVQISR